MEGTTVIVSERVSERLSALLDVLIEKGYYVYWENAQTYNAKLRAFAHSIPTQTRRQCKNKRYGELYCSYKPNRSTTWYFTFDTNERIYIIRNVLNNHTREYPTYIK